jgi:hypothetical protein
MKGKVWSAVAYDYSKGTEIYLPSTGEVFTQEEAEQQPKSIQTQLCIRALVVGCWVDSLETVMSRVKKT